MPPATRLLLGGWTWSSGTVSGFQSPLPEGRVVPDVVFILSQSLAVLPSSEFCEFLPIVPRRTLLSHGSEWERRLTTRAKLSVAPDNFKHERQEVTFRDSNLKE